MTKIIGNALPNIPWQERPEGCTDVVWRYSNNPVIKRNAIPSSNSIFNSAVVPFEGKFAGEFRCDSKSRSMDIFAGFSEESKSVFCDVNTIFDTDTDFTCNIDSWFD